MHYLDDYLMAPTHPITIGVIGCGGTGSRVLSELVKLHLALKGLERTGLAVTAFDPDVVSSSNQVRQLFYPEDVGSNKAVILISRINRSYGLNWKAVPDAYGGNDSASKNYMNNITITCTDTVDSRREIYSFIYGHLRRKPLAYPYNKMFYWLDMGNSTNYCQAALGTVCHIKKDRKHARGHVEVIPPPIELYSDTAEDFNNEPSCSIAESLNHQDLYVNSWACMAGMQMLWTLLKHYSIGYYQVFLNLENMQMQSKKL